MKKSLISAVLLLSLCLTASAQYDRDVFLLRGRAALSDGKFAQAIENFNIVARLDTSNYWNYFFRGIAKYNLGDIRGAQKDFNNSVRINPVFTNGYHYRAIAKSRSGEYDSALEDLQKALDLRPGNVGIYFSRGVTYFLSQQFESAIKDFDRYIRQESGDPSAYLNRGASYLFLKDTTKALDDYTKAISLDPYEPEGFIRRANVETGRGDYNAAITDLDRAISIDPDNTLAYFNRALIHYETKDYNKAMADLDKVLAEDPGNALTLYNRSLIYAQVGEYNKALDDMDRVIAINPKNVLAYFNRAAFFMEMERWKDAINDYTKAIELYPDFAKAYLNRSYARSRLGQLKDSQKDYDVAQRKVREFRDKAETDIGSFADTTKKYNSLLALDADFAKKDFDDEMLQNRDVDYNLRPLYKFSLKDSRTETAMALTGAYENILLERFIGVSPLPVVLDNADTLRQVHLTQSLGYLLSGDSSASAGKASLSQSQECFLRGLYELQNRQYNSALSLFNAAVELAGSDDEKDRYSKFYKAFYLMNRGALKADMIEFIASMENNVQMLTMDDAGNTRARVSDQVNRSYDYSEAIGDMTEAMSILPEIPYIYYNLGNLYCLSSQLVKAVENYDTAIKLYPQMGDAYYNRGLVLIYLKEKEKGCIDLSRSGELGVKQAYSIIKKYCSEEEKL